MPFRSWGRQSQAHSKVPSGCRHVSRFQWLLSRPRLHSGMRELPASTFLLSEVPVVFSGVVQLWEISFCVVIIRDRTGWQRVKNEKVKDINTPQWLPNMPADLTSPTYWLITSSRQTLLRLLSYLKPKAIIVTVLERTKGTTVSVVVLIQWFASFPRGKTESIVFQAATIRK